MNNCHMMCSNSAEYIWHSDSGSIISPIHSWSGRKVFYRSITPQKLRCLCSSSTSGLLFVSRILHQSCRSMTPILYLWQVYSTFRFLATGVHPNLFIPVLVQSLLRIIIDSSPSSVVYFLSPQSFRYILVNIASLIRIVYSFVRLFRSYDHAKIYLPFHSSSAMRMLILPDLLSTCTNRRGWVSLPSTTVPGDSM